MEAFALNPKLIRDISPRLLDQHGRLAVVPASRLQDTSAEERMLFGVRHGIYSLPTEELCAYLRERIEGRRAIEIGAGTGVLAQALGIPATDSRLQEEPAVVAHYRRLQQPTVPHGEEVERLDADAAIAKYRPEVVIACWIKHLSDESFPERGGSPRGVDEGASCMPARSTSSSATNMFRRRSRSGPSPTRS